MDISKLNKKELKDFVNTNGFFFHIQCDKIDKTDAVSLMTDTAGMQKTGKEIPKGDNIIVMKGIASQNYKKGEKSRNGYKYDQAGWEFDNYFLNPLMLWQHDAEYGGIGHSVGFWINASGDLGILFYVDTETLEDRNAIQVQKGYVTAISTGALSKECMIEDNETGLRYTEEDAEEKFGWENVWKAYFGCSDNFTLVITKAEMIENSLVTIGSNEKAMAGQTNQLVSLQDGIGNHFKDIAEKYKTRKTNGVEQEPEPVKKDDTTEEVSEEIAVTAATEENTTEVEQTPETPAVETPETEAPVEEIQKEVEIDTTLTIVASSTEGCDGDEENPDDIPVTEGDCECGKDDCDACKNRKNAEEEKNAIKTPEMKVDSIEVPISENQVEMPEVTATAENAAKVTEITPAENAESSQKEQKNAVEQIESKFNELAEILKNDYAVKSAALDKLFEDRMAEHEKILVDALTLVDKAFEQIDQVSTKVTDVTNRLKNSIVDGPSINKGNSEPKHPLAGRVKGLEGMMNAMR